MHFVNVQDADINNKYTIDDIIRQNRFLEKIKYMNLIKKIDNEEDILECEQQLLMSYAYDLKNNHF